MMKIVDNRDTTSWVPAVDILNQVIPHLERQHFTGIRSVVLLDNDYNKLENCFVVKNVSRSGTGFAER